MNEKQIRPGLFHPAFSQRVFFCLLSALFLAVAFSFSAYAAEGPAPSGNERILLFDSQAEFSPDGTMTVTETIRFLVRGTTIKRGFIRDLPLIWTRSDNKRFRLKISVLEVQRAGNPEPYAVTENNSMVSIRIGDAGKSVPHGVQEYRITYTVANHFSRFPDWDELYWNVTGNDWEFPMDEVRFSPRFSPGLAEAVAAAVSGEVKRGTGGALTNAGDVGQGAGEVMQRNTGLPAPWLSIDVYTGRTGEQGKSALVRPDGSIATTTALPKGQGLTVAYTWPRGILADAPDPKEDNPLLRALFPTQEQPESFAYWLVPLLASLYFMREWKKMHPGGGRVTVVPLFRPPDGLTPGRVRYALRKNYDSTAFSADLLQLVAKGGIRILPEEKGRARSFFSRLRSGRLRIQRSPGQMLSREESHNLKLLFSSGDVLDLSRPRQENVQKAFDYRKRKAREERKLLFTPYVGRLMGGLLFFFVFFALLLLFRSFEDAFLITFVALFFAVFYGALGAMTIAYLRVFQGVVGIVEFLVKLPGLIFFLPFWVALCTISYHILPIFYAQLVPDGFAGAVAAFLLVMLGAICTAPDRTREGLEREAAAKGLKMYLGTAEKHRFEFMYPPEESVEHFETLLPYALALGVGKTWANRFAEYLEHSGESAERFSDLNSWQSISRFSGASASAASSSKSSESSSGGFSGSGSRGGGSSGGGSGGGGGRGW